MQSLYLKHPHGFILLCFSHQFLSPLVENLWKIPEDNIFAFICFGLNPLLSFSFEFSCSLFSHREPPGFFHFILRLCYWTRWSSFILCFSGSERKKEKKIPVLWDLTNTSTSSLPAPVSCAVPIALRVDQQLRCPFLPGFGAGLQPRTCSSCTGLYFS